MKNLRELFSLYPLDCESFGAEWLRRWEAVGRLLRRRAEMRELIKGKWCVSLFIGYRLTTVSDYLVKAHELNKSEGCGLRVILLDGTIVREWGQSEPRKTRRLAQACHG